MKIIANSKYFIKVSIILLIVTLMSTVMTQSASSQHNAVCEIKIDRDETEQSVAKSLHFETYNTDPELSNIWNSLFGIDPDASPDYILTLQGPDRTITWEAGTLEMGGLMKIKVKTDKNDPTVKDIKIEKTGKKEVPTLFVSGTGGVNPNLADGGWHEVKIKNMDGVMVTFGSYTITGGFLKELKVKLDKDGTTAAPLVKDFKLKIKGVTTAPDVKKGYVSSVVIDVPETVVTAIAGAEYVEKNKDEPEDLSGHTEAEYERESGAETEGVDISSLLDGNNDQLKERKGACVASSTASFVCGTDQVQDADGNWYDTVQIGSQCWLAENLNVGTRIDGVNEQTNNGITEKYCYDNDQNNCVTDGGLYQWNEMMQYSTTEGVQGICPTGWHLPTDSEWMTMEENLGMCTGTGSGCSGAISWPIWRGTDQGDQLKTAADCFGGVNCGTSGFQALLAGNRTSGRRFGARDTNAVFWSSTESGSNAWARYLVSDDAHVDRYTSLKAYGFSVRCVKD